MASSSNSYSTTSNILDTVFKHIEEDKKRLEKLNSLIKSFQKADNEKTQLIQSIQDDPNLSILEQDYLNHLRLQCVKDWENTSKCGELISRIDLQVEEKNDFIQRICNVNEDVDAVNISQAIIPAESVEQFFLEGDRGKNEEDQYCLISCLPENVECSRTFWGVLLGFTQDNELSKTHVDAWIRRSQVVHRNLLEREEREPQGKRTRYAIMPISFHDDFLNHHNWGKNFEIYLGQKKPYKGWRNVDSVLIPVSTLGGYWFLLEYKIDSNELSIYDREQSAHPAVYMQELLLFYVKYICWFYYSAKRIGPTAREPPPGYDAHLYYKIVSQYPGSKENSAVFVCMFIHYMVTGEASSVVRADVSNEQVVDFRRRMANVLYAKRKM